MNKIIVCLITSLCVVFLPALTFSQQFKAGAAKVSITPPIGIFINGSFTPSKAEHIHDSLYAKAVVVDDGKVKAAFVVVDICVASAETYNEAKLIIEKQTGIPIGNIMISSTHTHSAGSIQNLYYCEADTSYHVAPPDQHKLGGYETWRSRTSYLEVGAEPKIKNALLNLLKKVN